MLDVSSDLIIQGYKDWFWFLYCTACDENFKYKL